MASDDKKKSKGGCIGRLMSFVVFLVVVGLGVALYFISQPQDLSEVGGLGQTTTTAASPPRDIKTVLQKSIEGSYSVTLSESEINQWLSRELIASQGGELAPWVSIKNVCIRLKTGVAEVVIEREIHGYPFTTSMFVQIEQSESQKGISTQIHLHGGGFHELVPKPTMGGRFGKLPVPQGFLILVMSDFKKIASIFEDEIELGFNRMAHIEIQDKRLVLDPRRPTVEVGGNSF
ncbi:hypothetical protein ACFSSA_09930 [Luteolibacter algae]|uniref:Uncharacterized protein n=1 Tax=Luteolibacter algae TaxID=454151 RepID=A0ABW5DAD2_9BACT